MDRPILIGAVAYDPRVVPIWEGMRDYFRDAGPPVDYVLYSNYDRQVRALLDRQIDVAWNTNLAWVKVHRKTDGTCRALALRDVDVGFTTVFVARTDSGVKALADVRGKRLALGSADSAQAAVLPVHFLHRAGVEADRDCTVLRFDLDVGKHGDTGTSELEVLKALRDGKADVGAVGDATWARQLAEGRVDPAQVRAVWTSPGYCHCNFTVLADFSEAVGRAWTDSLVRMRYDDPRWRGLMDLEGLKRWVPADADVMRGYDVLFDAVRARAGRPVDMTAALPEPAARVEGGQLGVADGLLMLIREAADRLPAGSVVAVRTDHPTAGHDLPAWCRITGHAYLGAGDGPTHYVRTGDASPPAAGTPDWGVRAPLRPGGEFHTRDWMVGRAGDVPEHATGATGFAPRGAVVEPGSPAFDFAVNDRAAVWAAEVADLYEQATANQWDASRDIPWADLTPLPEPVERAVCQVMTFLAENEYSALYVPAKFVPRINPQFAEVVFFLCTQMADEARHIEAFTKRALANGGGLQYAAASTQLSLKTLFDQHDFTVASFLLSVLGEGTFLDLLRFVEDHAPDPVTAAVCRRARADEARHVKFGIAHVRYYLGSDPAHYDELRRAVRDRAEVMASVTEVSPRVRDALAVLAAGGLDPGRLGEGTRLVRELMARMHENRVKRLVQAGFTAEQAEEMSRLHTPNFM